MSQFRTPKLRRHKPSQQGVVTLNGKDHYLGKWPADKRKPPTEAQAEYDRLIAEWLANGRCLLRQDPNSVGTLSVNEMVLAYWQHAERHYRHVDGSPTHEIADIKLSLRPLAHLYGTSPAASFGPLALKAIRQLMIEGYKHPIHGEQSGLARGVINQRIGRIRRVFKWATENEMVPSSVLHGLMAVRGLERGRSQARETQPVKPVPVAFVEATLPLMRPQTAAMVELQLLTGMRPGEVTIMRTIDIETSGRVWFYRPSHHKTAHRGHGRVVPIGPQAQEVLRPWLRLSLEEFLFQPCESMAAYRAEQRSRRKTKVQPSQQSRHKQKSRKMARDHYTVASYDRAITDAIRRANDDLRRKDIESGSPPEEAASKVYVPHWHPHQLRHTKATEIRREAGLDAARAVLGHRSPTITETYAEIDMAKASEIMARLG